MPGGGGDPAAQALAIQMKDFHPGRSPKPGAHDRHLAGLAQSLSLPHRDYCASLSSARRQLRRHLLQAGPSRSEARLALLWDLRHLEATCRRGRLGRSGALNPTPGAPAAPASPGPGPGAPCAGPASPHYLASSEPRTPRATPPDPASLPPEVFLPILGGAGPAGAASTAGAASGLATTASPATGPPCLTAVLPAADTPPPTLADRETMGADLGPPVPPKNQNSYQLVKDNLGKGGVLEKAEKKYAFCCNDAVSIWTEGYYFTGFTKGFKPVHIAVLREDLDYWKGFFNKNDAEYVVEGEKKTLFGLTYILHPVKNIKVHKKGGVPVVPLKDTVKFCRENELTYRPALEYLDNKFPLNLLEEYQHINH